MNYCLRIVLALCSILSLAMARAAERPEGSERRFTDLTHARYQKAFDEFVPQGFVPTAIRGYAVGDEARYDLTMRKTPGGAWVARHGLPHERFQREDREHRQAGMTLVVHSEFRVNGQVLHAALWRRPAVTFHTSAAIPETGSTADELGPLDELMRSFVKDHDIPGAVLAVARQGRLVYARGFGYADVERATPVQPDALFRIASVSKPITAMAVFRLVDLGKLRTGDRVLDTLQRKQAGALPEPSDARWREITVIQLLQHTAGFDRAKSGDPMFRSVRIAQELGLTPPAQPEASIRHMLGRPLDFQPGTRCAYSNFGYCLLGRLIEAAGGKSYEDFVRDEILKPLGITRMRVGATRADRKSVGEVRYYTRDNHRAECVFGDELGVSVPVQYGGWCLETMDAHGGWIASATDLVRLGSALDEDAKPRLLSSRAIREMFAPPAAPVARDDRGRPTPTYYACGWMVRPIGDAGRANTWHTGGFAGTSTLLVRRHDGFTWAVLFNIDQTKASGKPAALIDGRIHQAIDKIRHWPAR